MALCNLILVVSSFVFLSVYVIVMLCKIGIPSSVSATYYSLENKYWFGVTMVSTSWLLLPALLELTDPNYQFTAFLFMIGMMMCGVAPNFREGIDKTIHTTGAVMTGLFSQLWVGFTQPWNLMIWIPFLTWMIYYSKSKGKISESTVFWAEICGYISVYVTLFSI